MNQTRFLQIHSLHSYSGVLLNRDDSGLSKRLLYGGAVRTRISSQCLKRHWRMNNSVHSLRSIEGITEAIRSREIVTKRVMQALSDLDLDQEVRELLNTTFQTAVYGDKGTSKKNRQPLLLGEPEINFLAREVRKLAEQYPHDIEATKKAASDWKKASKNNLSVLRENTKLPGGIASALFGRMVTSDPEANVDAAIHVAHSVTVHAEEAEFDYFTVVDDLQDPDEDAGASHIGESELNSGLFYGYVVVDRGILLHNLGGDAQLAGKVVQHLIKLIATVSPGAKLGPTAPYGYAQWMLVEAGDWQPRSLCGAYRKPCSANLVDAVDLVNSHLSGIDEVYHSGESRQFFCTEREVSCPGATQISSLQSLADWAGEVMTLGQQ
ncbi:MAG: type I-E CRISPR-associated protein Cas7/Cse4/CasC [Rhodothermaceae bacterium]|nr:type I-E CRISPR-associated protein Cas7/Cse4/CasC [Rhodothermaceae bacterium]MXW31795.1 type I-E CRISPR-associated protein Cas7/Cse4/CasC [Rhodothermaceae bacterium]MYC05054.1 type I-E CRISPR-associated protein Cas7/Cse4/CasC [Rhodothermaceae bacterium]MYE62973.1 type I-E CRISPR-associated protein Cas7/Cse4/CasC [Rhodothermaceae bacterium]MYI16378.1 type I-E CRISPR-associated protein Cas7/Cse4/CasC [Rhodothermaceae bacterium]